MKKAVQLIFLALCLYPALGAQEKEKKAALSGYLTTMQSAMFDTLSGPVTYDNLLHNRLNFKLYATEGITFSAEVRNRLFTGDMARAGGILSSITGEDKGWVDMSWNILDESSFFLNTTVDRLWVEFRKDKFQATLGRQRINWGQAFVWNPNDIFNAYSFFDFDYIERPGSDALRLQYFPAYNSTAEIAIKVNSDDKVTAAALYRFSKWGYDIQFISGFLDLEYLIAGTGWSGNIASASFRGEATLFIPSEKSGETSTILVTAGIDKVFADNSMAQLQLMYCNNPLELNDFTSFYTGSLSSRDLAFSEFSAFASYTYPVTPLLNIGASAMWFPDLEGIFAGPSVDYSLAENVDFSLIWQHFNSIMGGTRNRINLGFLRIKYSF